MLNLKHTFAFTILAGCWILTGCEEPIPEDEDTPLEHKVESIIHKIGHNDLEILIIDGCEYFVFKETEGSNLSYGYMAHKGNCINPIHVYNIVPSSPDSTTFGDTLVGGTK